MSEASGMPCTLLEKVGSVHVGVGVDPEQSDLWFLRR